MQWIQERAVEFDKRTQQEDFLTTKHFINLLGQIKQSDPNFIDSIVDTVVNSKSPRSYSSIKKLVKNQQAFNQDMLITIICAAALYSSPKIDTWKRIKNITRSSSNVEYWLKRAMLAYSQENNMAREAYIQLSIQIFNELETGELKSESKRCNDLRNSELEYWQNNQNKLEELWYGLRNSDFMNYEEEMPIFWILYKISHEEFFNLITKCKLPFLITSALLSVGVGAFSPRFERWKKMVEEAPTAFLSDGSWNGSLLLPILLTHARSALFEPTRRTPRYGADETKVSEESAELIKLVRAVVDILARREDAPAMFARWSTWLMLQILRDEDIEPKDLRANNFVDNELLKTIGKSTEGIHLISNPPKDAAAWETWCYICAISLFSYDGYRPPVSFKDFYQQWLITPDDWNNSKCRILLKYAYNHIPRNNIPGLSANLLAFPISQNVQFSSIWKKMWDGAYPLREILEYGPVKAEKNNYSDRTEASNLLLMLACIGLACLDQTIATFDQSKANSLNEIHNLHRDLTNAVIDILYIDDTLTLDKWKTLLNHIALRRIYWDSQYTENKRISIFEKHHSPNISDYLLNLKLEPNELLSFLYACIINNLDVQILREELRKSSIDLSICVDTLKRLNKMREHKYPIDSRARHVIATLL